MPPPEILAYGESHLLLRSGAADPLTANRQVHGWRAALEAAGGFGPCRTGIRELLVAFDPQQFPAADAADRIRARLALAPPPEAAASPVREIPVSYGGRDGPDLQSLAETLGLSPAEVVAFHAAPVYTVAFLGFLPGFPYLLGLDPRLTCPRKPRPSLRVPAGTVAVAGVQTGIYPCASPGGWHGIGRTALRLFDPAAEPPFALKAGDRVRFVPQEDGG